MLLQMVCVYLVFSAHLTQTDHYQRWKPPQHGKLESSSLSFLFLPRTGQKVNMVKEERWGSLFLRAVDNVRSSHGASADLAAPSPDYELALTAVLTISKPSLFKTKRPGVKMKLFFCLSNWFLSY